MFVLFVDRGLDWHVYDCSLVAGNIMLLAESEGIGCCWIGFAEAVLNTAEFKKAHNVPDHFELVSTISMGYSNSKLKPATRRPPMIFSK